MCQIQATPSQAAAVRAAPAAAGQDAPDAVLLDKALPTEPVQLKHSEHYLWAVLIARIYEVFQLLCPICGG